MSQLNLFKFGIYESSFLISGTRCKIPTFHTNTGTGVQQVLMQILMLVNVHANVMFLGWFFISQEMRTTLREPLEEVFLDTLYQSFVFFN